MTPEQLRQLLVDVASQKTQWSTAYQELRTHIEAQDVKIEQLEASFKREQTTRMKKQENLGNKYADALSKIEQLEKDKARLVDCLSKMRYYSVAPEGGYNVHIMCSAEELRQAIDDVRGIDVYDLAYKATSLSERVRQMKEGGMMDSESMRNYRAKHERQQEGAMMLSDNQKFEIMAGAVERNDIAMGIIERTEKVVRNATLDEVAQMIQKNLDDDIERWTWDWLERVRQMKEGE